MKLYKINLRLIAITVFALIIISVLLYPTYYRLIIKNNENITQSNIHDIQIALMRCEVDQSTDEFYRSHFEAGTAEFNEVNPSGNSKNITALGGNYYPENIEHLINLGYLDRFPINPFTKKIMKNIGFKETPFSGEYTYFPIKYGARVVGFCLLGYGDISKPGYDVDEDGKGDHVVISVIEYAEYYEGPYYPEIKEVVKNTESQSNN
jgi:hypothetical protein